MKSLRFLSFKRLRYKYLAYYALALIPLICKGTLSAADLVQGERYSGPVVLAVSTVGQQQCMKECLSRPALCGGVNYKKEDLLCELVNSTEKTEAHLDYIRKAVDKLLVREDCLHCQPETRCVVLSSNRSYCVMDDFAPGDCSSLYNVSSSLPSGQYRIKLPALGHVTVFCEMETDGGGWTVFQRRMDGSEDFERTWTEYKHGFGNLSAEFWLGAHGGFDRSAENVYSSMAPDPAFAFVEGNEKLYHLLKQGSYEMRMDMSDFDNETRYVKYRSMTLSSETTKYVIKLSGFSGNVGDCSISSRSPINGMKFSTKDQDNDQGRQNCADTYRSGWWYNDCLCSNPNGLYLRGPTSEYGKGIVYFLWRGHLYSLKTTQFMVRREREKN